MKAKTLLSVLAIAATLTLYAHAAGQGPNQRQGDGTQPTIAELTETETANILHMREEEKLARDVYLTLAELWDRPVFANIAASEQRHMDAVGLLITKYNLDDPVTDDAVGVFSTPAFGDLYTSFTSTGAGSLLEALSVGVAIEEQDIADLEEALSNTHKADIEWVFSQLQKGSYNHLRAFTRNIAAGEDGVCPQDGRGQMNARRGQAGNSPGQGRGRGGRGNGNCGRNGNGSGQCDQQQKRDGSCLAAPAV